MERQWSGMDTIQLHILPKTSNEKVTSLVPVVYPASLRTTVMRVGYQTRKAHELSRFSKNARDGSRVPV